MNKKYIVPLSLSLFFFTSTTYTHAYNLNILVNSNGVVKYSYPAVLGKDSDSSGSGSGSNSGSSSGKSEDRPSESKPPEIKPPEIRPEKIEVKKSESKIEIEIKKSNKTFPSIKPEKIKLSFPASPKVTPTQPNTDPVVTTTPSQIEDVLEDRHSRKTEKVEIHGDTNSEGEVELHLESRNTEAKINDDSIELDLDTNNIASPSGTSGNTIPTSLNHLPDQALEKFRGFGIAAVPETLEVGESSQKFEYKVRGTKTLKLFGIFPRDTQVDLTLNDSTGAITQQTVSQNVLERLLNAFTF